MVNDAESVRSPQRKCARSRYCLQVGVWDVPRFYAARLILNVLIMRRGHRLEFFKTWSPASACLPSLSRRQLLATTRGAATLAQALEGPTSRDGSVRCTVYVTSDVKSESQNQCELKEFGDYPVPHGAESVQARIPPDEGLDDGWRGCLPSRYSH